MTDELRVNGVVPSFAHLRLTVDGTDFTQFSEISYDAAFDKELQHGTDLMPYGMTEDHVTLEGSLTWSLAEWNAFEDAGDTPINKRHFTMTLQIAIDENSPLAKYEFGGCSLTGLSMSAQTGSDSIQKQTPFKFLTLNKDGKEVIGS